MVANSLLLGLHLLSIFSATFGISVPLKRSTTSALKKAHGTTLSRTRIGHGTSKNMLLGVQNAADDEDGDVSLTTKNDLLYMANVTVGGKEYTLQLDTGSSDLWIATTETIPNTKESSLTYNLTYGIGYAAGHIVQAPVSFAHIDVASQAFLLATDAKNPVSTYGAVGILGLGFTSLSSIDHTVNKSGADWGRSFLYNAFESDKSTPNFITFALQRGPDPAADADGTLTIGEYADGLERVKDMPSVPTWPEVHPDRWNVLLDGFYISGVQQTLKSTVLGVPSGAAVTLMDSGTSYTYADPAIVDAMYGSIKGASKSSSTGMWDVPCDAEVDITLVYGGIPFGIHPLDVVDNALNDPTKCTGTFVGQSLSVGGGEFDWLIGDNVLRSIYTLYDFGDFDDSGMMGNPYMKMLPTTDLKQASIEFHKVRGGEANTTLTSTGVNFNSTASASGGNNPSGQSVTSTLEDNINKLVNYVPALLGILAFNSLVLLGLAGCAAMYFMKRRKGGKGPGTNASREDYHYQRVRSAYEPGEGPPPSPGLPAMPMANVQRSRPGSSTSKKPGQDSPFTPPVEIKVDETEGDMSNPNNRSMEGLADMGRTVPMPSDRDSMDVNPQSDLPIPRPRFVSTTTIGTDMYGRPQSLFSVSSSPLLGPGQSPNRPASTYDIPPGAAVPRHRMNSMPMSDGRPDSTFSTTPLINQGPTSPMSDRMPRPSDVGSVPEEGDDTMMPPPRPRFMSDANRTRPESSFSMGGAQPMRPQSKFIDASGERPFSTAM